MKPKTLFNVASIALLTFVSCTDDMQELKTEQSQFSKQIVMTTQDFQQEVGGRTLYGIADGAVTCTWAENDTVGVFPNEGIQTAFPMSSGAGTKKATFDGGGWALKDGNTYAAYYPNIGEYYLDKHALPVDYTGQTQVGNASMAHLGAYDYMVAAPTVPEFGSANFVFKHLSALVQLKLTIPQPATITSVKLVTETDAFAVKGKVDIMADAPVITPVVSAKEVVLGLKDMVTTEANQVITLYMMLPPADLSTKTLKAIIITDRGRQEVALGSKNFKAGTAYALSGEMDESDWGGAPFVIKQKNYSLSPNGSRFVVDIRYKQPYKILKMSDGIISYLNIQGQYLSIKEEGHDKITFMAFDDKNQKPKEIIISDEAGLYTDTIRITQTNVDEMMHLGNGNSFNMPGWIMNYTGGEVYYDLHTNQDNYEVLIFSNTLAQLPKYLRREKMDFGFREYFEIPTNNSGKDIEFVFANVGSNITQMIRFIVKRQLFVYFDEPDEMYISDKGETFTTHAWTEDDNLNIRLEGTDTSWLIVKQTDDTYVDGVRRINTTFEAEPNNTGKTREITIVAYNGFNDNDVVRIIQPSGDGVLMSRSNMIVGGWKNTQTIKLKDCAYTIEPDKSASWVTIGTSVKENGAITQTLNLSANNTGKERNAVLVIKSGSNNNTLKIRQLPEADALVDDTGDRWKSYKLPPVNVKQPYPNEMGSMLYFAIVENPQEFVHIQSRRVLDLLYFGPDDQFIPKLNYLEYKLDNYDGISACYGGGGMKGIVLSNQYVESYYNANGAKALVQENKGVLSHELTHAFQLEPKGCGDYNTSKVFNSCVEGMADAVRVLSGGFPLESDRPKGGHYLNSYRYTGFFIAWCVKNKDKDFLRKFNLSTQYVNPWSFDGAIKYVLGDQYNVDDLWNEYLKAMGDI